MLRSVQVQRVATAAMAIATRSRCHSALAHSYRSSSGCFGDGGPSRSVLPRPTPTSTREASSSSSSLSSKPSFPLESTTIARETSTERWRRMYDWWEHQGYFRPIAHQDQAEQQGQAPISLVLPPPNVTGSLHLGHALTNSIEDALARYHRMSGRRVQWVPGTDHAGIATQAVVEKKLLRERKVSPRDIGREAFVAEVWQWKATYGRTIVDQLKLLGASLDWSAEVFTLDEARSKAVVEAFVRLFHAGYIRRNTRLVNWSCRLQTAISDIEVDTITIPKRQLLSFPWKSGKAEVGVMHKFAYPVEPTDGSNASTEELVVATTRLETMLGDAAIVVHPDDARYAALVGRHAIHPFDGRRIPIISDPILVDPTLGTGAVKITPAHDLNDFECASRHKLPVINIFTDDGCMNNAVAADFRGADRHDARRRVLLRLQEKNLYRGASDHPMTLSVCSRSGDLLEPMLRPQWYVRSAPLAARAFAAANPTPSQEQAAEPTTTTNATTTTITSSSTCSTTTAGDQAELTFTPSFYLDEWNRWTGNPQDWCVSRQLWWGHRIPAFRVQLSDAGLSVTDLVEQKALETLGQNNTFTSSADASSERVACWSASEQALWIVARSEQAARVQVEQFFAEHSKSIIPAFRLEQDPDVLDTWFSSGLYPLSAHNWPEPNWNQHGVYPLTALETGADILFFWVARMVMLCSFLEPTYGMPFSRVLLHPMVRDSRGRKMSKSLGNVIDPLHVLFGVTNKQLVAELEASTNLAAAEIKRASADIQKDFPKGIPACGPDALRLSLLSYMDQNVSFINFDVTRAVYAKNFLNKLLNATAYTLTKGATPEQLGLTACAAAESSQQLPFGLGAQVGHPEQLSSLDLWALGRLREAIASCQDGFGKFHLARVTSSIVRFGWHELCDVYVEGSKAVLNNPAAPPAARQAVSAVLRVCLDAVLRLGHPILPFATEELWHHLLPVSSAHQHSIMVAAYPTIGAFDAWLDANRIQLSPAVNKEIELVQEVVKVLRQVRQQHDVRFSMLMDVRVQHDDPSELASIEKSFALVALLARASTVTSAPNGTEVKEPWVSSAVNPTCSVQVSFRPKVAPKDSQ